LEFYPWYVESLTIGISSLIPMVFWPPTHGILNPLRMVYRTPTHDISHLLSMVYRTPYHGILISLPMVYRIPCSIYVDPLPMVYGTPSFGRNKGVQYTMIGFNRQWPKICLRGQNTIWYIEPVVDVLEVPNTILHRFMVVFVLLMQVFCVMFCKSLLVILFFFLSFAHCIVCPSIHVFVLSSNVFASTYFMIRLDELCKGRYSSIIQGSAVVVIVYQLVLWLPIELMSVTF
jgi:hypothetical protein